jgi:ABC-type proline/glycine betaine transport system permease subunit
VHMFLYMFTFWLVFHIPRISYHACILAVVTPAFLSNFADRRASIDNFVLRLVSFGQTALPLMLLGLSPFPFLYIYAVRIRFCQCQNRYIRYSGFSESAAVMSTALAIVMNLDM